MKNEIKMEPKGLPEFPGKSRKSHPSRPRRSQETPGIPKGTPRHPTAAKRKIDATVIATATPPTQLSNNTTSKTISALRNARSA